MRDFPLPRQGVLILLVLALSAPFVTGCGSTPDDGVYEVGELQKDFRQMRKAMESLHPQLYRFTDKVEFDQYFDLQYASIDRPMGVEGFYRIVKPVVARIGCGHARTYAPEGYWDASPDQMFPLDLVFLESGTYVSRSYGSNGAIGAGAEVISINGLPMSEIVHVAMSDIAADGYNESWKRHRLKRRFAYLYALYYGFPDQFVVTYRAPEQSDTRQVTLAPTPLEAIRNAGYDGPAPTGEWIDHDLGFEVVDERHTAILSIKSFAYYDEREKFYAFVDKAFQEIRALGVENLILDFRGNDGGDPFCSTHLLSYIQRRPVRYFATSYRQYEKFARPIPLARNQFRGDLFILIDGGCYSSTGHLCAVLDYHNIGQFVGIETGGTYTCNDASKEIVLDHTGIRINMPRMTFTAAVYDMPRTHGILPDHPVEQSVEDLVAGRDTIKEYALQLARESD